MTVSPQAAAGTSVADPAVPGYDAVLLAGFGGPEGPDDVMPFLRNVTRGRGIPDERLVEVSHHYQALGGRSPINEQNRALRAALQDELDLPVLWGNRNWAPYLSDVVRDAHAAGLIRLLGVATSAYSSYSSCRQYREDFGMALQSTDLVGSVRIDKVQPYFDVPGFRAPFVDGTVAAVRDAAAAGVPVADLEIVFTTHSIPSTMAGTSGSAVLGDHGTAGGAYVAQHLAVAGAVIDEVSAAVGLPAGTGPAWQLAYQSRSGPPSVPWLDPDVNDVITALAGAGRRGVIVVPIGFVSDHVEVIWDLDREAAQTAREAGLFFARVGTPGTDPRFVADLAALIRQRLAADPDRFVALAGARRRPDFCAPACCVNARVTRPTTAAVDSAADWQGLGVDDQRLLASGIPGVGATSR
jgi:ferrochelatase